MKCYIIITILIAFFSKYTKGSCFGCVELDEITFKKLIPKFKYALIKFDIAFPYGDKHEAYSEFAKIVSPKVKELLIGAVGVKDYGEKENSALAKHYKIDETDFPVILLFKNYSVENLIRYPLEEINSNNLRRFIRNHSDLYIGLDGTIEALDVLAGEFITKATKNQKKIIQKAEEMSQTFKDDVSMRLRKTLSSNMEKKISKVYLSIMRRITEKGMNFIDEEKQRIKNLLKDKVSENKKKELTLKLNILESFEPKHETDIKKDEL